MYNKEDYVEVDNNFLLSGMYIFSDVYYIIHEKPVLLCSHTIFTETMITKLDSLQGNDVKIYVSKDKYKGLEEQHNYIKKVDKCKEVMYKQIQDEITQLFLDVRKYNVVEVKQAEATTEHIYNNMYDIDLSYLIQYSVMLRTKNQSLYTHSVNVGILNGMIARWMKLSKQEVMSLIYVGVLHDLGKIPIPDSILNKPGKLTTQEYALMKTHPLISYDIMVRSGIRDVRILEGARGHHEKLNGSGYPDSLSSKDISLYARITAVSDIYDAMVAQRPYKDPKSPFEVMKYFCNDKFSDIDMNIVDVFVDKMTDLMYAKKVILNNGRIGKIAYINKSNIEFPMVELDGKVIQTTPEFKCVTVCADELDES